MDDLIREAFKKVKEDISQLRAQLISLVDQINGLKRTSIQTDNPTDKQTLPDFYSTQNQTDKTDTKIFNPNRHLETPKAQKFGISIRNKGVALSSLMHALSSEVQRRI